MSRKGCSGEGPGGDGEGCWEAGVHDGEKTPPTSKRWKIFLWEAPGLAKNKLQTREMLQQGGRNGTRN